MKLAIKGGEPLRKSPWGSWPIWNDKSDKYLTEVIQSKRWSIRGSWTGVEPKEVTVTSAFSQFNKCSYCALTTSGTMGLSVALEALNISYGDEVIVPALTWIAPITSVLNVGAIPVMVDVEKETTCMSPNSIRQAITSQTKAILVVHLHCSVANMDEILKIAKENNLYIIEDCSQAHGAMWGNNYVGTMGDIGVFSLNQEKVLTCGEGGAIITNNIKIFEKIIRTKTDGCDFDESKQIINEDQLIYDKEFMGSNYCISEFQSAVLLGQLEKLEEWNAIRRDNADYLDKKLSKIKGLIPLTPHAKATQRTYYEYGVIVDLDYFGGKKLETILNAVSAEINISIHPTDVPVYNNDLFSPWTKKKYSNYVNTKQFSNLNSNNFPNCEYLYNHLAVFHHRFLMGSHDDMDDIANAFEKVQACLNEL